MKKLIILDRDGVINVDSPGYIKTPQEWIALPNSVEAIALLNSHGYDVVIATNQSGIARGYYDEAMLAKIHQKMLEATWRANGRIRGIFYCPHGPEAGCACRKPLPGLLWQIAEQYNVPLSQTLFVGDSWRDILAAKAGGAQPVLVLTGNGQKTQEQHAAELTGVKCFTDLYAFACSLI